MRPFTQVKSFILAIVVTEAGTMKLFTEVKGFILWTFKPFTRLKRFILRAFALFIALQSDRDWLDLRSPSSM